MPPHTNDQVIDTAIARVLHADACQDHALVAWTVLWDLPAYSERFAARLATSAASPYLLLADTLAGIRDQLPPGLVRSERMPVDPPEVVEIWFAG
jgi:glutamine synthetase